MRDLFVTSLILGCLPFILRSPKIGVMVWCWIGLMNPHRLCWGFAYDFPFAQLVAGTLLISLYMSNEPKQVPWTGEAKLLLIFTLWMFLSTAFAFNTEGAWEQWGKVWKVILMTYVTMMVIKSPDRLQTLVWVIVVSLGLYGIKGGIFTIMTGGAHRVLGPANSFIGDRGPMALALNMTIPMMRYLQLQSSQRWVRWGLGISMMFTGFAIIGTHSRGGFLGAVAMAFVLIMKSRQKIILIILLFIAASAILNFMPSMWGERMQTIENFEQDASAMGRINAWYFAYNLASDNFLGGGFECFKGWLFGRYAPEPGNVHDAHNIFFEVLGEHGFVGLFIYCLLMLMTWRTASKVRKYAKRTEETKWLSDLVTMVQVSIVGFVISGSFVGMAYFDYYYYMIVIVIASRIVLEKYMSGELELTKVPEKRPITLFLNLFQK